MTERLLLQDIGKLLDELETLKHPCKDISQVVREILEVQKSPKKCFEKAQDTLSQTKRFRPHGAMKLDDTVEIHTQRGNNTIQAVTPLLQLWNESIYRGLRESQNTYTHGKDFRNQEIDIEYLKALFRVHDIGEGLLKSIGDIPTPIKSQLSPESKKTLGEIEILVLDALGPKILGIPPQKFPEFLRDTREKESLEALLGGYIDKTDGICAALYDFLHGNDDFLEPIINYIKIFRKLSDTETGWLVRDIWQHSGSFQEIFSESSATGREDYPHIQYAPSIFTALDEIIELGYVHGTQKDATEQQLKKQLESLRERFISLMDAYQISDITEFQGREISGLPDFYLAWIGIQKIGLYNPSYHSKPYTHIL